MPGHRDGRHWENFASKHLARNGLEIVERNFACRFGEIDLIARDGDSIVIVEVRARSTSRFGSALESVNWHKQERILKTARYFLMRNPEWSGWPLRIDVIAIDGIESATPRLNWVKSAFDAT